MIKTILLLLLLIPIGSALSENLHLTGQIGAWGDGLVSYRAGGQGIMELDNEVYAGGRSVGFNLSNGKGSFSLDSGDYSVQLSDFAGSIVAESDQESTTVDGNGTGSIKTKSYDGSKMGMLVTGLPSGEINGRGVWVIHASTARGVIDNTSPMDTNVAESAPVGNETVLQINSSTEFPI